MLKNILYGTLFLLLLDVQLYAVGSEGGQKEQAKEAFERRDFEQSYQLYSEIYLSELSDVDINFYYGRSAYETGRYEIALAAFERVEVLDPTSGRNKLELAKTQYQLGMYEDAKLGFNEVSKDPLLPETLRKDINTMLEKIDDKSSKSSYYGNVKVGVLHDSNVNHGIFVEKYELYSVNTNFLLTMNGVRPKGDYAVEAEVNFAHVYDIGEKGGFKVRNAVTLYDREYDTLDEYDTTFVSYRPSLVYQEDDNTYELTAIFNHMSLANIAYINSYGIMPSILHKIDENTRVFSSLKYAKTNYLRSIDNRRDSDSIELALGMQKVWDTSYMVCRVAAEEVRMSHGGTFANAAFNRQQININYTRELYPSYSARVEGEVERRAYKDHSTVFQNSRTDQGYKTGLALTKRFDPTLSLEAKATYERTFSNQIVYGYDKRTLNLALNKSF